MSVHFKLCFLPLKVALVALPPYFTSSGTALGAGGRMVGIAFSGLLILANGTRAYLSFDS